MNCNDSKFVDLRTLTHIESNGFGCQALDSLMDCGSSYSAKLPWRKTYVKNNILFLCMEDQLIVWNFMIQYASTEKLNQQTYGVVILTNKVGAIWSNNDRKCQRKNQWDMSMKSLRDCESRQVAGRYNGCYMPRGVTW